MFGKFWGLFFGAFWGPQSAPVVVEPEPPAEVPVPVVFGDPLYTDHVTEALDRLCEQFRGDPDS